MYKYLSSFCGAIFLFCVAIQPVHAQLLTVTPTGEVVWNVLSDEDELLSSVDTSTISVTKVNDTKTSVQPTISLRRDGGDLTMRVVTDKGEKTLAVTDFTDNVIEIEERPTVGKLTVTIRDGKFVLNQGSMSAITDLPISIDPLDAKIAVKTSYGESYVGIFPLTAAASAIRSKFVSSVTPTMDIVELDGEVLYKLSAEKVFQIISFYDYSIPVEAFVSAQTGEIIKIDSPTWYKYVGLLFA
jgi:hypothetical protein